jgi:hypothetical protein
MPLDVVSGGWVAVHSDHDDPPEGAVPMPVAASVEPVASRLAGGGLDRAGNE